MRSIQRVGLVVVASLALLVGCSKETVPGADTSPGGDASPPQTGEVTSEVTIAGFAFDPSEVTIAQGDSLTITNEDSVTHTFTTDDGSIDERLDPGDSVSVTIDAAGGFHCEIHPSMTGTISLV